MLQDSTVYYYPKPGTKAKGHLILEAEDSVHPVTNSDKSEHMFSINTAKRSYLMYTDSAEERAKWIAAIEAAIAAIAASGATGSSAPVRSLSASSSTPLRRFSGAADDEIFDTLAAEQQQGDQQRLRKLLVAMALNSGVKREVVLAAVSSVEWVAGSEDMSSFFELFKRSIPWPRDQEAALQSEELRYSVRRSEQEVQLVGVSVEGNVAVLLQRVVDFLWACGASEAEFCSLETLMRLAAPASLGLWTELRLRKAEVEGGYQMEVGEERTAQVVQAIGHARLTDLLSKHVARLSISGVCRNCSVVSRSFTVTFRLAASQVEMVYGSFDNLMPLPLTLIKNLRLMEKGQKGDYLRAVFSDDGGVAMVELSLPQEEDDFLAQVLGSKCNVVSFRVTAAGTSHSVREWRNVLREEIGV